MKNMSLFLNIILKNQELTFFPNNILFERHH